MSDTGLAIIDQHDNLVLTKSIKTTSKTNDFVRCVFIAETIINTIKDLALDQPLMVAIEAIPFARRPTGKTFTRTEILGMVKYLLGLHRIPTHMIGATTLKGQFAGHGHAEKNVVQAAVFNRFKRVVKNDNVADAIALAALLSDFKERKKRFSIERLPMDGGTLQIFASRQLAKRDMLGNIPID